MDGWIVAIGGGHHAATIQRAARRLLETHRAIAIRRLFDGVD
jgi:hypothetical protein